MKFSNCDYSEENFNCDVAKFIEFLSQLIDKLPGPKHPALRFYEARKQKGFKLMSEKYNVSNPVRKSLRKRTERQAQYEYQITQFLYYNQRRKAVRKFFNNNQTNPISINIDLAYN